MVLNMTNKKVEKKSDASGMFHFHPNGGGVVANSAIVDSSVHIGKGCIVKDRVEIHGNVVIDNNVTISDDVVIRSGSDRVVIKISDNVTIRGNVTITGCPI